MGRWLKDHGLDSRLAALIIGTLAATVVIGGLLQGALLASVSGKPAQIFATPVIVLLAMAIFIPALAAFWLLPGLALFALTVSLARHLGDPKSAFCWAALVTAIGTLATIMVILLSEGETVGDAVDAIGLPGATYLAATPFMARWVYTRTATLNA